VKIVSLVKVKEKGEKSINYRVSNRRRPVEFFKAKERGAKKANSTPVAKCSKVYRNVINGR